MGKDGNLVSGRVLKSNKSRLKSWVGQWCEPQCLDLDWEVAQKAISRSYEVGSMYVMHLGSYLAHKKFL
jgi:hypothetical protein